MRTLIEHLGARRIRLSILRETARSLPTMGVELSTTVSPRWICTSR